MAQDEEHYVVRAGLARPDLLVAGTRPHRDVPGLTGFSVQSAPGLSVEQLARAARFPHGWVSVTTLHTLRWHGFDLVFPTPGQGVYHATVLAPYPLSSEHASLLSSLFTRRRNPYQSK